MIDLTVIVKIVIALVVALVSTFAIPWLKSKTTTQGRDELLKWVEIAVAAAQQLYYQYDGETRLNYAMSFLRNMGYNVKLPEVQAAVEAAVLKLHSELKEDISFEELGRLNELCGTQYAPAPADGNANDG